MKPYVPRGAKNDAADAAAIGEAVARPNMRFVPVRREPGLLDASSGERFAGPPEDNDVVRDPRSLCRVRYHLGRVVEMLGDEGTDPADHARMALVALVNQLKEFDSQIDAIECQLGQIQIVYPAMFRSGREFAAWSG